MNPGTIACAACGFLNSAERDRCALCGDAVETLNAAYGPGDRIHGKYEVLGVLGVSSMGEAYKVRHEALDVLRCIKLFGKSLLEDEVFKSDFLREARLSTRAHHPNIALVHDIDVCEDGRYYIVWEYVDGLTIGQWSRRHGRYPHELAALLVCQALSGLSHIHAKGLLHHNLSTDNVMVTLDFDGEPAVKITDLGVGRVVGGSPDAGEATTQVGMILGNPKYASPERLGMLGDQESIDHRSDLYCLAVVLYEMIAGAPPFTSPTPQGYLVKHLTEPPPPFASVAPGLDVPTELQSVVLRALQKNRNHRFGSASEFMRALEPFVDIPDDERDRLASLIESDLPSRQPVVMDQPAAADDDLSIRATQVGPLPEEEVIPDTAAWQAPTLAGITPLPVTEEMAERLIADALPVTEEREDRDELASIDRLEREGDLEKLTALARRFTIGPVGEHARNAIAAVEKRLLEERRRAEEAAWSHAEAEGTASAWTNYLTANRDSYRADGAAANRDEAQAFEETSNVGELERWDAFLKEWPIGPHHGRARQERDEIIRRQEEERLDRERVEEEADWGYAELAGTSDEWARYVSVHPTSVRASQALVHGDEAQAFEVAAATGGLGDWEAFLAAWPDGPHRAEATRQRDTLVQRKLDEERRERERIEEAADWERAERSRSSEDWAHYIAAHPDAERANRAVALRDEARAFELALAAGRLEAWDAFLASWTDGVHHADAVEQRRETERRLAEEAERAERERVAEAADWQRAVKSGTSSAWAEFLDAHPTSERRNLASDVLAEARDFESAVDADQLDRWNGFLVTWPDGAHSARAEKLRRALERRIEKERRRQEKAAEAADWDRARDEGTAAAWTAFLEAHPDSKRVERAYTNRDEAWAFETTAAADELDDWNRFLDVWPRGTHAAEAASRRDELARRLEEERRRREQIAEATAWDRASREATSAAWSAYLEAHPASPRVDKATEFRREAEELEETRAAGDLDRWNAFLSNWPDGPHHDEARSIRDELQARLEKEREEAERERLAESADWDRAVAEGNSAAWSAFLAAHPRSARVTQATSSFEEAKELESALETDTLEGWRAFVSSWPDGAHAAQAVKRRDEHARRYAEQRGRLEREAWARAASLGTASSWEAYLTEHGDSERAPLARRYHDEAVDFIAARMAGSVASWTTFLGAWPDGAFASQAVAALREAELRLVEQQHEVERWAWEDAMNTATVDAWTSFLERFPNSSRAGEARVLRDQSRDFQSAVQADSPERWNAFLEKFPDGPYAARMRDRLARHRDREVKAELRHALRAGTVEAIEKFLAKSPDKRYAVAARDALAELRAFEALATSESERDWLAFLDRWPAGPHGEQARAKIHAIRKQARAEEAAKARRRHRRRLALTIGSITLVVALAAGVWAAWRSPATRGWFQRTPSLTIDALPWARVTSVRDASGKDRLPSGPQVTPVALFLPQGAYDVVLEFGAPMAESRTVRVRIGKQIPMTITEDFAAVDARAFFEESGW